MSYGYDVLGRIDTITFPDAQGCANAAGAGCAGAAATTRRFSYGYDALNRLIDVVANVAGQAADQHTTYAYDAVGNRSAQTHPNGSTVSYQYDRRNRLTDLAHRSAAGLLLLLGLSYQLDASGLRTGIVESQTLNNAVVQTRSASYAYDALKRLTQSNVSGSTSAQTLNESFTYDAVGNRLTRSCVAQVRTCSGGLSTSTSVGTVNTSNTYDANDRLTREQWTASFGATWDYSYDAAGNLLSKKQGATTLASYTWDIENRLTDATLTPTTASKTISRYQYDPNGIRRIADVLTQTSTTSTRNRTEFLIDPNQAYAQVLEDWTASASQTGVGEPPLPEASLQTGYVYGDDLVAQTAYTALAAGALGANAPGDGGNDALARIGAPTGTRIAHVDGLGSTRLLTAHTLDAAGQPILTGTAQNPANETVTDRYAHSAFGDTDLGSSTLVSANAYRYTGEQLDPNLGWYYLRARYMNPGQGRFIGMDSFAGNSTDPVSLHKYLYANANPVMFTDPSGRNSLAEVSAASDIQGILITVSRVESVLNTYSKVNSAIDLVLGLRQLLISFEGDFTASIPRTFPPRVDFSDAASKFASGAAKAFRLGSPSWLLGYAKDFTTGSRMKAYVIYLPVLAPQIPSLVNSGTKINGKPVKLGLGAPGGKFGSLGGVGVVMGRERLLFRMDIGLTPVNHIRGRGSEIDAFDESPFSFHVYDWRGGPR